MKAYIIGRVGWEYNDENFYRSSDYFDGESSVVPQAAYLSKDKALAECERKNIEKICLEGRDLPSYTDNFAEELYSCIEQENQDKFNNICLAYGIMQDMPLSELGSLSDEKLAALLPVLPFAFYEVTEIEIEDL